MATLLSYIICNPTNLRRILVCYHFHTCDSFSATESQSLAVSTSKIVDEYIRQKSFRQRFKSRCYPTAYIYWPENFDSLVPSLMHCSPW